MSTLNAYQLIDGRESGPGGGTAVSLTFSFLTSVPSYYSSTDPGYYSFSEFTNEQKDAARSALEQISQFANVTFTEVTGSTIGDVTFGQASLYYQGSYPYALTLLS